MEEKQSYATYLKRLCPRLPEISLWVLKISGHVNGDILTFPITCTDSCADGSGAPNACDMLKHVPLWNDLLWHVNAELREVTPYRLAVKIVNRFKTSISEEPVLAERAAILFHCLLTKHKCIDTVEVDYNAFEHHTELLCDALQTGTSMRVLHLTKGVMDMSEKGPLITALCQARQLEELDCADIELLYGGTGLDGRFADFVRNSTSMRTLRLTKAFQLEDAGGTIKALQDNSSITKLAVDGAFFTEVNGAAFARFITGNTRLTELTLLREDEEIPYDAQLLFESLKRMSSLRKLVLRDFQLDYVDAALLLEAIAMSRTLEEVDVSGCEWTFLTDHLHETSPEDVDPVKSAFIEGAKAAWGQWWRIEPFVKALRGSTSIRVLVLGMDRLLNNELRRLLAVVKESHTLQQLRFKQLDLDSFGNFCDLLLQTGTAGKVTVDECCSSALTFVKSLKKHKTFPCIAKHEFSHLDAALVQQICTTLALHDTITAISLVVDARGIDERCARAVAAYLAKTTTLREVDLQFDATGQSGQIIINALSENRGLEKLKIEMWDLSEADMRIFMNWIQCSRTLHTLFCHFRSFIFSRNIVKDVEKHFSVLATLTENLANNHTLTVLKGFECLEDEEEWLTMKGILCRNASLVERAAHFVCGSTLKRCASAFELLSLHPLIPARVQELASVSAEVANRMLKESMPRLQAGLQEGLAL